MKLDTFTRAYLECALWSSTDGDPPEPLDKEHGIEDLAPEALASAVADCTKFQAENSADLDGSHHTDSRAGHDFWLTRNGHGAGFWDGDWPEGIGDRLDKASKAFGESSPYVGDDGRIYFA